MGLGLRHAHCTPLTACSHAPAVILLQRCERFVRNVSHEDFWRAAKVSGGGARGIGHRRSKEAPRTWLPFLDRLTSKQRKFRSDGGLAAGARRREKRMKANKRTAAEASSAAPGASIPNRILGTLRDALQAASRESTGEVSGRARALRQPPTSSRSPATGRQRAIAGDDPHGSAAAGAAGRQRFRRAGQCGASAARGQVARAGGA